MRNYWEESNSVEDDKERNYWKEADLFVEESKKKPSQKATEEQRIQQPEKKKNIWETVKTKVSNVVRDIRGITPEMVGQELQTAPQRFKEFAAGKEASENVNEAKVIEDKGNLFLNAVLDERNNTKTRVDELEKRKAIAEQGPFGGYNKFTTSKAFLDKQSQALDEAKKEYEKDTGLKAEDSSLYQELTIKNEEMKKIASGDDPEVLLVQEKQTLETYDQFVENSVADRGFLNALIGTVKNPLNILPFVKDITSGADFIADYNVMKKYEKGEGLSNVQLARLNRIRSDSLKKYIEIGLGDKVGEMVGSMPKYGIEFWLTSSLWTAGKEAVLKKLGKTGASILAKELLIKTGEEGIKFTLKENAARLVSGLMGSMVQTVGFVPTISSKTAEYMLPEYDIVMSKEGKTVLTKLDEGDSFTKALTKAGLMQYVEVATERAGFIIEDPIDFMKKSILSKYIVNMGIKDVNAFSKIASAIGWNGIIGEVFEEELTELFQAPIEERKYYAPFITPEGSERLWVETLGIAAYGGLAQAVGNVTDTGGKLMTDRKLENDVIDISGIHEPIVPREPTGVITEEEKPEEVIKEPQPTEEIKPEEVSGVVEEKELKKQPTKVIEEKPTQETLPERGVQTIYHGTTGENIKSILQTGLKTSKDMMDFGEAVYFGGAEKVIDYGTDVVISDVDTSKFKVFETPNNFIEESAKYSTLEDFVTYLKETYGGVYIRSKDTYAVYDTKLIKDVRAGEAVIGEEGVAIREPKPKKITKTAQKKAIKTEKELETRYDEIVEELKKYKKNKISVTEYSKEQSLRNELGRIGAELTKTAQKKAVKIPIKKTEKELQAEAMKEALIESSPMARPEVGQYKDVITKAIRVYNLNKAKGIDDISTITKKVPEFDSALEALRDAGHEIKTMDELVSLKNRSRGVYASMDLYADLPNVTQKEVVKTGVPFPEMVRLAKDLMGNYPKIKLPRVRKVFGGRPYGLFIPKGTGEIILNPAIFNDIEQASKTLAHEMGHLTDYLPDQVTARGNLLGRIGTLRKFLRGKFTSAEVESQINELVKERKIYQKERQNLERDIDGNVISSLKARDKELLSEIKPLNKEIKELQEDAIKNTDVKNELRALSKKWKPFQKSELMINAETGKSELVTTEIDESEVSEEYLEYRFSPEELYADALSVLLNDPVLLKQDAPIFYEAFFNELHRKPEVKEAYFELMDFLNQPDDVIQTKRLDDLYEGFKEAREKRLEIERKVKPKKEWVDRLMAQHVTRFDPIYSKLDEKFKNYGLFLSPKTELRMQLEEMQMRNNDAFLYLNKVNNNFVIPLEKIGLTEDDLGVILNLESNLGARKDIANPYGLQGEYSQEVLKYFRKYLSEKKGITDEQFNILQQVATKFRENQFKIVTDAKNAELYSSDFYNETALPNKDSYVTHQVVEYIHDNFVSAGVKKAVGTLKKIENPFVSSVLKTMAVINQTEIQKGKLAVVKQLEENFPDDISKSKPIRGRGGDMVGWKQVENRVAMEVYKDGKRVAYDVDPYIERMFEFYSPTEVHNLVRVSGMFNKIFKPLVTTWNISWGLYSNISRDTRRTYKNLASILPRVGDGKGLSVFEYVRKWIGAIPEGIRFQKGNVTPLLEEMLENKAYTTAFAQFDSQANEDKSIAPIMRKFRFLQKLDDVKEKSFKKKLYDKTLSKLLQGIEFAASTFETTSKVSAYQITQERVKNAKLAGFITRNYAGTPNFIDGGTQKNIDNQIFVFSNVMIQGVRTDLELATNPTTRSGYWYNTFLVDILPTLMMVAASSGLLGDWLKDIFSKATEYDKTNYIIIPLGIRSNGKAVYLRIPRDETGRFFGALTWKIGTAITGDLKKPEQLFSIGAGYIPSVTPMWEVGGAWMNYAQGRNPYDNYRGRQVVDDLTWKAGGLPVFEKMVKFTTNQLGFSQFTTYSDETDTTLDLILKQTPIINRAIRSTDFGLTEKEQVKKKELDQKSARRSLNERKLLEDAVKEAKKNPDNKADIEAKLIKDALGDPPYDEKQRTRLTNLRKKFAIGQVKGEVSREMDNLIDAVSNDYKVELLKMYKESLSVEEYNRLIKDGMYYKIISDELSKLMLKEGL